MSRIFYCPICGNIINKGSSRCKKCYNTVSPKQSNHDIEYYKQKSNEKYNTPTRLIDILIAEEVSKGSSFDMKSYKEKQYKSYENQLKINIKNSKEHNIPKCPTCGSTNIKKISSVSKAAHGLAFGLFSKTARSQFECLNCHYKW